MKYKIKAGVHEGTVYLSSPQGTFTGSVDSDMGSANISGMITGGDLSATGSFKGHDAAVSAKIEGKDITGSLKIDLGFFGLKTTVDFNGTEV